MFLKNNDYIVVMVIPGFMVRGKVKNRKPNDDPFSGLIIEDDAGNLHYIRNWTMAQKTKKSDEPPKMEIIK